MRRTAFTTPLVAFAASTLLLSAAAVASDAPATPAETPAAAPSLTDGEWSKSDSGLKWRELIVGTGAEVVPGSAALVHYTGWLTDGTKFDSSHDRGPAFKVAPVGRAGVIRGWNEGLVGMKAGGKRRLLIPPDLAYGERGYPPIIPPGSTLVFDVEVVQVTAP